MRTISANGQHSKQLIRVESVSTVPNGTCRSPFDDDEIEVLRFVNRSLARRIYDSRHSQYGRISVHDIRKDIPDCWRLPLIFPSKNSENENRVIFLFDARKLSTTTDVQLRGSFEVASCNSASFHRLRYRGRTTGIHWLALDLPRKMMFFYEFVVNRHAILDPINPQRCLFGGREFSRFFTEGHRAPLVFTRREQTILSVFIRALVPLKSPQRTPLVENEFSLGQPAGAVEFIDHWLAREEWYHREQFRGCLAECERQIGFHVIYGAWRSIAECLRVVIRFLDEIADETMVDWNAPLPPLQFLSLLRRLGWSGTFASERAGGCPDQPGRLYLQQAFRESNQNPFEIAW